MNRLLRIGLTWFWNVAISAVLFAQAPQVHLYPISIQNGLSNSSVYSIYQDAQGFLWFGTAEGLNRFDGYDFHIYTHHPQQPFSIAGEMITDIDEDPEGNLWLGVWYGGLNYFDKKTGRFYTYLPDENRPINKDKNSVWTVAIDPNGYVWAGTQGNGLYRFDPKTKTFKVFQYQEDNANSLSSNSIAAILPDQDQLWIATDDGGLNLLDLKTEHFQRFIHKDRNNNSLISNNLNALLLDHAGNLWIGSKDQGISVLSKDRKTFANYAASNAPGKLNAPNVRCFLQDDTGTIWIGTDGGGINFYNPKTKQFTHLLHDPNNPNGIRSNVIFSLYQSRDGIIWIGTYKGGVNVFDPKKFKFQTLDNNLRPENLSYKVVLSVFEDSKKRIWFGTDGGGLNSFDPVKGQFDHFVHQPNNANSLSGNAIKSIYEDAQGNLWAGTYGNGLNYLPKGSSQWIRYQYNPADEHSLSNNHAWDIAEDPDGNLWIATLGGGVNVFDRVHHTFKRYNANNTQGKLLSDQVFTLLPDGKRHRLWVGTARGLCYFDWQKEQFFPVFTDSTHLDYEVKVIHQDTLGRIWFGTKKNGVHCYNPENKTLTSYWVENGLISNTIAAILEDEQHFLWISTNRGISRLDPSTGTFYNYTTNDGLRNTEYLSESAYKLRNGNLLFGGSEGFDVINSTQIPSNDHLPNVVLTKLWVLNKEILPGTEKSALAEDITVAKNIRLRHFENVISFEFAALNFTNTEKNQYAYWLENFDKTWNYIGNRRLITFTNLNPGTYTLHVKAANNEGRWNEQGTSLQIHILPPWWQTLWFRILIILIVAGSIFGGFTYRIYTIKKHKRELQRLVHQRTEELAQEKEKVEQQNETLLQVQGDILLQNEEIRKQRDDIQAMSEKIHRADQEKLDFFTNISHEIRTPLTLIISPLEQALHALSADNPLHRSLNTVYRNAQKLVLLVNQMLDLRKIENKGFVLRAAPQDIVYMLQQILSAFTERATQQDIALHFTSEVPKLEVWLDYEKLDKIISNLLANALKFTPAKGEISIHIKMIETEHKGQNAQITISDTGIGIPAAQLDQIFDAFYQADNAQQLQRGGTGIGLAIAKSLTELHHGTIQVQSEVGKGTQFLIQLPLGNAHLSEAEMVSNSDAVTVAPTIASVSNEIQNITYYPKLIENDQRPTILIVEDNADLRAYLRECLEAFYHIHEAANGREGIAKALEILPHLILSDIMMPEMDGLQLCKHIKTRLETSHIPVILLTAKSAQEHKLEGLEIGADDYIAKPFDILEVQIRIANLIQNRQLLRKKFSQNITLDPQEITLTPTDAQFLQKALAVVEQHLSDPAFSVTHFVQHMGVSRSLLHVKLKELTDQSASDFIRSIRLKRAAQLLVQKQLTVAEVAYTVGFNDPKYFHKCFKERYSVTPGNFAARFDSLQMKF